MCCLEVTAAMHDLKLQTNGVKRAHHTRTARQRERHRGRRATEELCLCVRVCVLSSTIVISLGCRITSINSACRLDLKNPSLSLSLSWTHGLSIKVSQGKLSAKWVKSLTCILKMQQSSGPPSPKKMTREPLASKVKHLRANWLLFAKFTFSSWLFRIWFQHDNHLTVLFLNKDYVTAVSTLLLDSLC